MSSSKEIAAIFAMATTNFDAIIGQPTDDDIFRIREVLMPLLHDISYDMAKVAGTTTHNLVGLIQEATSYATTWGTAFPRPIRIDAYDITIKDDATPVGRSRMEAAHTAKLLDYNTYVAAEKATALFIRTIVDEQWYKDLRNAVTFYNSITAYDLLDHLVVNSGGLHTIDLVNLPTEMLQYYASSEGIPDFINKLEEAREKLDRGSLPMSDAVLLATASSQVFASLHYPEATREWERLAPASQTWPAWQVKYRLAHVECKRLLKANPLSFGTANSVTNDDTSTIAGYLDNLALAATNDSSVMASILAKLEALTVLVNIIKQQQHQAAATTTTPSTTPTTTPYVARVYTNAEALRLFDPTGYCSTHGWRVKAGHTSATCTKRNPHHKEGATRADTMRGCNKNKGWETNPNPM